MANARYTNMFPPSANWYCAKVSDWSNKGLFAFGTKNSILLLDVNTRKFVGNLIGHTNKISAVSFNKHDTMADICVSGSADKAVRVWDCTSFSCKASHTLHKNEVNALALSPVTSDLIVSGDKDGLVVIWRTVTDEKHTITAVDSPVYCIACSPVTSNEAAIGYANGMVVILQVLTGSVLHKLGGHTDEVHALSWSIDLSFTPSSSASWIAPASPSSSSSSSTSASSSTPTPEEPKQSEEDSETRAEPVDTTPRHYLASASRDKTIRIWEGWGIYRSFKVLHLPKMSGNITEQQKSRVWLTVDFSPHNPHSLISSSHAGDLLAWNLKDKSPAPHRFSSAHSRSVFNIHHSKNHPKQLISISMDRQIVCWDLRTHKSTWRIPGLGGFVYAMDVSPLDPMRVTLAVGDNTVRVWVTNSKDDPYDSVLLWKGIQAKVTAVSYHPTEVGILGYGLDDGRVGIIDTYSQKQTQFSGGHRGTVYEISWRPLSHNPSSPDSTAALMYSCGDGIVYEWDTKDIKKVDQPPKNINTYIEASNPDLPPFAPKKKFPSRSDAVWNNAGNLLVIGNNDGSLELFDENFRLLKKFTDHRKLINRIRWHPVAHKKNIFATASDDTYIRVYDISELLSPSTSSSSSSSSSLSISGSSECIQVLKGHEQQVSSVAWSPHDPDLLVSGSFDSTAQVWNISTGQALSNMRGHEGRVFSVAWSPMNPLLVFSCGDDQTARAWDYTTQPDQTPPGKPKAQKKTAKEPKEEPETKKDDIKQKNPEKVASEAPQDTTNQTTTNDTKETEQLGNDREEKERDTQRSTITEEKPAKSTAQQLTPQKEKKEKEREKEKEKEKETPKKKSEGKSKSAFLHLQTSEKRPAEEWEKSCIQLANKLYGSEKETDSASSSPSSSSPPSHSIDLYLGRTESSRLMGAEIESHAKDQNWDHHATLELWKGNVGQALKTVVSNDMLDANWVAMSILAGRDVWTSMCVLYAKQLEEKNQPHLSACFYLTCSKPREAVEVYKKASLFRDALMLAKTRFAPDDPIIEDLYMTWGRHQEKSGHFIPSAMCYMAAGHPTEAIQMLASRAGPSYLSLSSKLARVCDPLHSLSLSLANSMRAQAAGEWQAAREEFDAHEELRMYTLVLGVERAWVNYITQITKSQQVELTDIDEYQLLGLIIPCRAGSSIENNQPSTTLSLYLYASVLKFWNQNCDGVVSAKPRLSGFYQQLLNVEINSQLRKEKREQFSIAHKLTLAILAQLGLDDPSPCLSHYLEAIHEAYKSSPAISSPLSPSTPPSLFASSLLRPILNITLPVGEESFSALQEKFTNSGKLLESIWAFYKFGALEDYTKPNSSTIPPPQEIENLTKVLLVDEHAELQKLKSEEIQMTSSLVESELALKRHKGSKSAKKGKTGKSTELKTEMQRLNGELEEIRKRIETLEAKPKFPDPEKSSQVLAIVCSAHHPSLSHLLSHILSFGISHAYTANDKNFWTHFTHPSTSTSDNNNNNHTSNTSSNKQQSEIIIDKREEEKEKEKVTSNENETSANVVTDSFINNNPPP